mgnify:CR=1 FL=1
MNRQNSSIRKKVNKKDIKVNIIEAFPFYFQQFLFIWVKKMFSQKKKKKKKKPLIININFNLVNLKIHFIKGFKFKLNEMKERENERN